MRPALVLLLVSTPTAAQDAPPKRLPPRPERTAEQSAALAAELRAAYSKPPAAWPKPTLDPGVPHHELGPLPAAEHPARNPYSKDKAELGKALFFDARLSGSGQMACASCHDPDLGWADGRTTSFGHARQPLKRNAPTVLNAGLLPALFWDGRAATLEDQVKQVLANPSEMRAASPEVTARLEKAAGYPELFEKAFGDRAVSADRVADAVAWLVGARSVTGQTVFVDSGQRFVKSERDVMFDRER